MGMAMGMAMGAMTPVGDKPYKQTPAGIAWALEVEANAIRGKLGDLKELCDLADKAKQLLENFDPLFAPMPGRAMKPYTSCTASLQEILSLMQREITAYSKLPASTEVEFSMGIYPDSSTLQLTLRWPTSSTENKAGDPGPASPERVR